MAVAARSVIVLILALCRVVAGRSSWSCRGSGVPNCHVMGKRQGERKHKAAAMLQRDAENGETTSFADRSETISFMEPQRIKTALEHFAPWEHEGKGDANKIHADEVSLDENGYAKIARQRNPSEMETFFRRTAKKMGLKVSDEEGLREVLPKFDGTEESQSYAALEFDMIHQKPDQKRWVEPDPDSALTESGTSASLDGPGYFAVAKLHDQEEMKTYVRRVVNDMQLDILNEGEFDGLVSWYSGVKGIQDMDSLRSELTEISKRKDNSWLLKHV